MKIYNTIFKLGQPLQRIALSKRNRLAKKENVYLSFIAYNSEKDGRTENLVKYRMIGS